jgi:hypothetical protein
MAPVLQIVRSQGDAHSWWGVAWLSSEWERQPEDSTFHEDTSGHLKSRKASGTVFVKGGEGFSPFLRVASQAESREFESRRPLHRYKAVVLDDLHEAENRR